MNTCASPDPMPSAIDSTRRPRRRSAVRARPWNSVVTRSASARNVRPASVSSIECPTRAKISKPISSSSFATCSLTADCETWSRCAARVKLLSRATARA